MQQGTHHRRIFVLFGDQLFAFKHLKCVRRSLFFMAEDHAMCTRLPFHKQKLTFMLASMRHYANALRRSGLHLNYLKLKDREPGESYWETLADAAQAAGVSEIAHFETENTAVERRMALLARRLGLVHTVLPSPKFIGTRDDFDQWASQADELRMDDYYLRMRRQLSLLIDAEGRPINGRPVADTGNRQSLPRQLPIPDVPVKHKRDRVLDKTIAEVESRFADHPGSAADFWLPVTARHASVWLDDFLEHRLTCFGDYQEAITRRSDTVFHSVISPFLNSGLLTPADVVERATRFAESQDIAFDDIEGFLRQLVGWREFSLMRTGASRATGMKRPPGSNRLTIRSGRLLVWAGRTMPSV
jgi:deoxyribodipyrimidine photolyase-related protein